MEEWAVSPCKDCKNFKFGCRDNCELYKAYKEQIKKNKDKYHKENHSIYWVK